MSKGNGRFRKNSMGNGMDKFHGAANGITSSKKSPDESDYISTLDVTVSDMISGNTNTINKGKELKNKLK